MKVRLLGTPQICYKNSWQNVAFQKTYLLIFYLVYRGVWVSRDEVAALFYPKSDMEVARVNLRSLLKRLRKTPLLEFLEIDNHSLRFLGDSDVKNFLAANAKQDWQSVVKLYTGELLKGFSFSKGIGIGSWLDIERQNLKEIYQSSAMNLALNLKLNKRLIEAAQILNKALKEDLLNEAMVQLYMECTYLAGRRWEALKLFESFQEELENDLNVSPLIQTLKLAEQIRQNEKIS